MKARHYILDNKKPVPAKDVLEWGLFFNDYEKCQVAYTEIGVYAVSTVFIGLDHNHGQVRKPLLFGTMIFKKGGTGNVYNRYATWIGAEAGHYKAVETVKVAVEK